MSLENPLWGAPRIHGELLKLGFEVAQSSVAKHMVRRRGPPSQKWRTFLRNHTPQIAVMDLFVVPTIGFDLLYAFVIVRLARRDVVWQCIGLPDGGMDRAANYRSIPLERGATVSDPRSRRDLWSSCQAPTTGHGHPRQTDFGGITMVAAWRLLPLCKFFAPRKASLTRLWNRRKK